MTALQREPFLRSVLMLMPEMAVVDHRYLFGTGPFIFLAREFASNYVTHDERRYRFTEAWFKTDPRLSLGGPTIGWARQAVRSMSASLAPGYLERIELPLVLMTAGQDRLIDITSHAPVVARISERRARDRGRCQARDHDGDRPATRAILAGVRPACGAARASA